MLADEGLAVDDQSDRILEVRAQSKNGPIGWNRRRGTGSVSASAAKDCGAENADAGDGIVHRRAIGRSPMRKASAMPESCCRASSSRYAIGSLERFALVITRISGAPAANNR